MRQLLFALPLILFGILALYFQLGLGRDPRALPSVLIDQPVPVFDAAPLWPRNPGLASTDLQGELTLVNFFSSWCGPCRIEHPFLMYLSGLPDAPRLVGINYKERGPMDGVSWLRRHGNPYRRIGTDPIGRLAIDWGVTAVPETFLVDSRGRIRYRYQGPLTSAVYDKAFRPLLRDLSRTRDFSAKETDS